MDLSIIKAMATIFTTSSYRPGLGAFSVPHNPNKRVDPDQLKIRIKYEEEKPKMMNLMAKQIWCLSKYLYQLVNLPSESVSFIFLNFVNHYFETVEKD